VLREYNVALALTDTLFVPRPWEMKEKFDLITADFAYVRWLGNRKEIEEQTTTWDKTIFDRTSDLKNWVEVFKSLVSNTKVLRIFAFSNNHYAGMGQLRQNSFGTCGRRNNRIVPPSATLTYRAQRGMLKLLSANRKSAYA
jgi:hypothetical protein